MNRDTCRMPYCENEPGEQTNRSDYNTRLFCSIQHETLFDKRKADAREARLDAERR